MRVVYSANTDVGKVRKENQDSFGVLESRNLYIACDGMGGGAAGDFASRSAVEVIMKSFEMMGFDDISRIVGDHSGLPNMELLRCAVSIRLANRALHNFTVKYPKLAGMGTTVVAVLFDNRDNLLHIYHVGDSRVYRFRNGVMEQLTRDHSKVNELIDLGKMKEDEAKTAEIQSMITRALGTSAKVKVDYSAVAVFPGDHFILFTDGLNTAVDDNKIKEIVLKNIGNVHEITKQLIDCANNSGGQDNTTVITLKIDNSEGQKTETVTEETARKVVTIGEESASEIAAENRFLKSVLRKAKILVPEIAIEREFLNHPIYLSAGLTLLLVTTTFFVTQFLKVKYDTRLEDLTGRVAGISIDVRTPKKELITSLINAEDNIQKLQIIQDCYRNKEGNTVPLKNVEVLVESKGKKEFHGFTAAKPIEIKLSSGSYTAYLKYPGYKIIDNNLELKNNLSVSVELSASFKLILVIMVSAK